MNARNAKANGLRSSWNHVKLLTEKVGYECAKAETAYEKHRKPNPMGRPKCRISLVARYGFSKNQTRTRQMADEKDSSATRKICSGIEIAEI